MRLAMIATLAAGTAAASPDIVEGVFNGLAGNYAPGGICFGQEVIFSISRDYGVSFGETGCQLADAELGDGGLLRLNLTACQSEGEPQPDRIYELLAVGDGGLTVFTSPDGGAAYQLLRCSDL